jgi:uncharacterized GH25 family protein
MLECPAGGSPSAGSREKSTMTLRFVLLLLLSCSALQAHEFWIEPTAFQPAPGQRVGVRLRVGEQFRGDPVPRNPKSIERFAVLGPGGEIPVEGVANTDPAGFVAIARPGLYQIVYDSALATTELDGEKFEKYLGEEGLERISALRAERGETAAPAKEVYSRSVKALIAVGGVAGRGHDLVAGLPLELVPEKNPYTLAAGAKLPVHLLYQGKPLAGALVVAIPRGRPAAKVSARSDARGRVELPLDEAGLWLVKAVHMVPAPQATGADWESLWASLTFEIPARKPRKETARPGR